MKRIPISVARSLPAVLLLAGLLTAFLSPPVVRAWEPGTITTVAGNGTYGFGGDGGGAVNAQFAVPAGLALDASGNLFIADEYNHRIRMIPAVSDEFYGKDMTAGYIYTIAGNGTQDFSGDGGQATSASLNRPYGVAVDGSGNVYIADHGNHRIRKVDASGTITTAAGDGTAGFQGDNGPATSARLSSPCGIACDGSDNVYIADTYNHCVRMIPAADGTYFGVSMTAGNIYTVAGTGGTSGYSGDVGAATSAELYRPFSVHVDSLGHLFIADTYNHAVRMVASDDFIYYGCSAHSGNIYTIAGTGVAGSTGDGGPAVWARLNKPSGVVVAADRTLLITDSDNNRIRKVDAIGYISRCAGTTQGYSGDGGAATSAQLYTPFGVVVDSAGSVFVSEMSNHVIRKVSESVEQTVSLNLQTGWNMVSVPVEADDMLASTVFAGSVAVYTWDPDLKSYVSPDTIEPKRGYWVAVTEPKTITVTGTPVTEWTGTAYEGWNMIGSLYGDPVTPDCLTTTADPDPLQRDDLYCWDPVEKEFQPAASFSEGAGYFLASAGECDLRLKPPAPV